MTRMNTIIGTTTIMAIMVDMAEVIMAVVADITADIMADTIKNDLQIFLCRHGETEWTNSGRHTSISDIPLTEDGKTQAVLLGKRLTGVHFHKVFVSPMLRAEETCNLAGQSHAKIIEPGAMEWDYGEYEGLTTAQILEKNPDWNLFDQGAPGGESPDEVSARADHFLKILSKETGRVAVFSHAHFSRVLAARWIGEEAQIGQRFFLSVGSISILGYEHERRVIQLWNDTGHL